MVLGTEPRLFDFAPSEIGAQVALDAFDKASFGGDRSAAGRYAAQQRWKGHQKKEEKEPPSAAEVDLQRIFSGNSRSLVTTPTLQAWATTTSEASEKRNEYEFTRDELLRAYKDGIFDMREPDKSMLIAQLERSPADATFVRQIVPFNTPQRIEGVKVNPAEPHLFMDVHANSGGYMDDAAIHERPSLEKELSLITSPKNAGPATAGTANRWEKAWETDGLSDPYRKEISTNAAFLMGEVPESAPNRSARWKGKSPSPDMLMKDAKDLLQSINNGQEAQPVLWRGILGTTGPKRSVMDSETGDIITIGLGSTSRDAHAALRYAHPLINSVPVMMRIEQGSKGYSIGDAAIYRHDQEVLTSGKFEVTSVDLIKIPTWRTYARATESPTKTAKAHLESFSKLRGYVSDSFFVTMRTKLEQKVRDAEEYEKETTTVRVISVKQAATFDPITKTWKSNG